MAEELGKQAIEALLEACTQSLQESLRSLVGGKRVEVVAGDLGPTTPEAVTSRARGAVVVVRGALEQEDAGRTLRLVLEAAEAATIAGAMTMTPEPALRERRGRGVLDGDDQKAFADVANVLCAGIDAVLRRHFAGKVGLRVQDHAVLAPGENDFAVFGSEPLVELTMQITVDGFPASTASLLVDRSTAERWNGGSLPVAASAATASTSAEVDDDEGPAVPIRGRLAAFLVDGQSSTVLRRACRRVGLELDRRPRGDVPNPAGLKDAIVLIEVAPAEERRFDWCRRVKTFRSQTKVVLLLLVPSRQHVLQAARAGADVVLGQPVSTQLLTHKLSALLEPAPDVSPQAAP